MTYAIDIPSAVYTKWQTVRTWQVAAMVHGPRRGFEEWMPIYNPEILAVSHVNYSPDDIDAHRIFTFKSEAHYTWFLLQQ